MAKNSVVAREKRRTKLCAKFRDVRQTLKNTIADPHSSADDKWNAVLKLQELPRDSSRVRKRNRCMLCGRPRSYNRLTGLCRLHFRSTANDGKVPGARKSSW